MNNLGKVIIIKWMGNIWSGKYWTELKFQDQSNGWNIENKRWVDFSTQLTQRFKT